MLRIPMTALLVALTLGVGTSRPAESRESLAELTKELSTLNVDVQRGDATRRASAMRKLLTTAQAREQRLLAMIADRPDLVLRHAVPAEVRATLPRDVQDHVEEHLVLEGDLEVLYEDGHDYSRTRHFLKHAQGRFAMHFVNDVPDDAQTGDRVRVSGLRVQQALALGGSSQLTTLALATANTFGEQKVALILLRFQDNPTVASVTPAQAQDIVFNANNPGSLTNFYREASYGQTWLTGKVYGPYTITVNSTGCDYSTIATQGKEAATAEVGSAAMAQYNRFVYAFPRNSCPWSGIGTVGGNPSTAWINGAFYSIVVAHELGHNFGMYHSHALSCGDKTIGVDCDSVEYGDDLDTMGRSRVPLHFNAAQKERLGWRNWGASPPITTVGSSGVYSIEPYESTGEAPKALRIPTPSGNAYYYVEYRQPVGFDAAIETYNPGVKHGVVLHRASPTSGNSIYLLLATPHNSVNPSLGVGSVFTDPQAGISIATVWANGTAGVDVTLGGGGGSTCVQKKPTVAVAPAQQQGPAGTKLSYNVSVTNNNTGCSESTFTTQALAPVGWAVTLAPSLKVATGATVATTMQVTSSSVAAAGAYTISATIADASRSALGEARYAVTTSGSGSTFSDDFNRADGDSLGNGWTPVSGGLIIRASNATNQPARDMHSAVRPELVGATQTATATFEAANTNLGPRFVLLVRHNDARNYYACYRQTGGSSVLRIARVVNGVEKILKAVAVNGAVAGTPFTLGCEVKTGAAGTATLTASLDGKPLVTASDATFVNGSVGFGIGYAKSGSRAARSHQASHFSASVQ